MMNYENDSWFSRGTIAGAVALIAIMITAANYRDITAGNLMLIGLIYAVGLYGLIPARAANWVFGLLCIVLVCTLIIMFPLPAIAIVLVLFLLAAVNAQ